MFRNGRKNKIHNIFIITIAAVVFVLCIIFCGIGQGALWFPACGRPSSEVSLLFIDPTGQESPAGVQVGLIRGHDKPDGKSSYQTITEEDGSARLEVPSGEYTIRWQAEGYYGGYQNITAGGEAVSLQKRLLPYAEGISAYILLEWEGEQDLDLCVYDEQNDRYIGRVSDMKGKGSRLYADDDGEKGYELVYLKFGTTRNYIIYVKDGDSIAQNYESGMEQSGVTVSIYTESGLLYQKKAEAGETAGLWKCAFLCKGEVAEQDEYIYDLTDYAWAERDKHNPDSWAKESDVKVEEVYYYAAYGLDKIERAEYDNKDCVAEENHCIENLTYNADGQIRDGFREERAYDEQGNWLMDCVRRYEDEVMISRTEYQYDKYGNHTLHCTYDQNGILIGKYRQVNKYDSNGNLIFCSYYNDLNEPSEPLWEEEWEYNEAGEVTAQRFKRGGLPEYEYTSERDAAGNLLEKCEYSYEEGELESREESKYDMAGNEVKYSLYDGRGNLISWEEYECDTRGNKTASYRYSASDGLIEILEMEYDAADRPTTLSIHNPGDWAENREWRYDAEGMKISEITRGDYDYDGVYEDRSEQFYDVNGNIMSWFNYEDEILVRGGRYEYDQMGNETASYSFIDGDWIQKDEYTYEYEYDAVAGMMITNKYENNFLITKTITIIADCVCNKQDKQSTYTAYIESEKINESHVEYPQIQGLKDLNLQRTINKLLRSETTNGAKVSQLIDNQLVYSTFVDFDDTDVSYEYKSGIGFTNESLASFWYSFTGYGEKLGWQGYVDRFYGLTINMKTGEKIHLTDFMEVDERLICSGIPDASEPDYNSVKTPAFYTFKDAFMIYMTEDEYDPFHIFTPEYIIDLLKDTEGETMWYIDEKGKNIIFHFDKYNYVSIPITELKDLIYPEYQKMLNIK